MKPIKSAARWNRFVYLTSSLFVVFLVSCSLPGQSPASEAEREARRYWEQWLTKCGDSYVWQDSPLPRNPDPVLIRRLRYKYECRPARIEVVPNQLEQADRLNGIEWKGSAKPRFDACRRTSVPDKNASKTDRFGKLVVDGEWSNWVGPSDVLDGTFREFDLILLQKNKGNWILPRNDTLAKRIAKADCSGVGK